MEYIAGTSIPAQKASRRKRNPVGWSRHDPKYSFTPKKISSDRESSDLIKILKGKPKFQNANGEPNMSKINWFINKLKSEGKINPPMGSYESGSVRRKGKKGAVQIPAGKRHGSVFTSQGKRYTVVSYKSNSGKRVRYARGE